MQHRSSRAQSVPSPVRAAFAIGVAVIMTLGSGCGDKAKELAFLDGTWVIDIDKTLSEPIPDNYERDVGDGLELTFRTPSEDKRPEGVIDTFGAGAFVVKAGEMRVVSRLDGREKASGMDISADGKNKATLTSPGARDSGTFEVDGDALSMTSGHRVLWFKRAPDMAVDWAVEPPDDAPVDAGPGTVEVCGTSVERNTDELTCEEGAKLSVDALKRLPNLGYLVLDGTAVDSLDGLERFPRLGLVSAERTAISNIDVCRALPNLLGADFSDTAVSDLSPLRDRAFISVLDVSGTKVSDLGPIAGWHHLNDLDLHGTPVRDVSTLANHTYLEELDLSETQVTDIRALSDLRWLSSLSLKGTRVSVEQLAALRKTWEARGQKARIYGCGDLDDDDAFPCVW